ncbi:MAG: hypothetical protein FOGNACKC_03982 [Anaerolineae bacterium]|nr:hypothetical protein [Anaerolineae bacterium]
MIETTLEFTVAVKANEATLHTLQNQLNCGTTPPSPLGQILPELIKETLQTTGPAAEVEVALHPGHLVNHFENPGGLASDLWQEVSRPNRAARSGLAYLKARPGDEILCSD